MCVLILTVRETRPEMATLLCIGCGAVLTLYLLGECLPLLSEMRQIAELGGVRAEYLNAFAKALGICLVVQTSADVCRDAGQTALAHKLETGGKLAMLLVAFPLLRDMLSLAEAMIGA